MPKVFVSYRREDSKPSTGRLCDSLRRHLGHRSLFRDIGSLHPGTDFVDAITEAVSKCDVLIAVIGKQWSTLLDSGGKRRLDDPKDFVCREIELALQKGIPVIPVLVDGASMPAEGDLPAYLSKLARCHAIELDDEHWDHDIRRLLAALPGRWRSLVRLVPVLLIAGLALGLCLVYRSRPAPPPRPPVIGVIPFRNDWVKESLTEAVKGKLELSGDLRVAPQPTMAAVFSAARTGEDLARVAAALDIDYLLTGEVLPGMSPERWSLRARVAATDGSRPIEPAPIDGLAKETFPDDTQKITVAIRKAMGLPARDRVDLWAADFPTSEPEAYLSYIDGLQALSSERYEVAKRDFSTALQRDSHYVMARYRLAWAYALAGETDEALTQIRIAVASAQGLPDRARQYLRAAELYFARQYEDAGQAYRHLIATHPFEIEARQHLADILMATGCYEEAVRWWRDIEAWEPQKASPSFNLGAAYLEIGRYDDAVQKLEESDRKWPGNATILGLLGNAYQALGDFERAAREYEAAFTIDPHLYNIVIQRAVLEVLRGRSDEAVRQLTPIVSESQASATDRIDASLELAYLLRAGGRFGEAGRLLRNREKDFAAEQVRGAWALSLRALCAMESPDLGRARTLVQRALRRTPEGPRTRYLFTQGLVELQAGSMDAVRRAVTEISTIHKPSCALAEVDRTEDKAAEYLQGMALLREGKPDEAIRWLSHCVRLRGYEYRIYRLGLARAYLRAGRLPDALTAATEAARRRELYDPRLDLELDRNLALLLLARIEWEMGHRESAAAHAKQFLSAWKHADQTRSEIREARQLAAFGTGRRKISAGSA